MYGYSGVQHERSLRKSIARSAGVGNNVDRIDSAKRSRIGAVAELVGMMA